VDPARIEPVPFTYDCPVRWGDLDAQGHVNNGFFVDYLQEARVHFLLAGPPAARALLDSGVLVVSHAVEYLRPVGAVETVTIQLWVDAIGGSRFVVGYDLHDGEHLAARARTALVPYDLAGGSMRRLTGEEREFLSAQLAPAEPLRPLAGSPGDRPFRMPLPVRWSDLDSYGHVNNVKFYDYVQQARIALINSTVHWSPETVWMVARQDVQYRAPLDFRTEPYEVATWVTAVGNRSFTLGAEIGDPGSGTVYATAGTVVVGSVSLTTDQRAALSRWLT
jgi:acyl-CoA thioester hydrolase